MGRREEDLIRSENLETKEKDLELGVRGEKKDYIRENLGTKDIGKT